MVAFAGRSPVHRRQGNCQCLLWLNSIPRAAFPVSTTTVHRPDRWCPLPPPADISDLQGPLKGDHQSYVHRHRNAGECRGLGQIRRWQTFHHTTCLIQTGRSAGLLTQGPRSATSMFLAGAQNRRLFMFLFRLCLCVYAHTTSCVRLSNYETFDCRRWTSAFDDTRFEGDDRYSTTSDDALKKAPTPPF